MPMPCLAWLGFRLPGIHLEVENVIVFLSVADPGPRILIFLHLGSRIPYLDSLISDPTTRKKRTRKKFVVLPFFVAKIS
jgi:hypothetical protein